MLGKTVDVVVDRALGSAHPEYPSMIYPVNYGYVPGIPGGDGEEQDAYILGVDTPVEAFTGRVAAIVHRRNDVETKWVVVPPGVTMTADQVWRSIAFQEQYYDSRQEDMELGEEIQC